MKNKKTQKVVLNNKEKGLLSGLLEAHRCKIVFLDKKAKENKSIQDDIRITKSIERKLLTKA